MDKSGVSKEAQDDALSDGISGGRQTPTGRPTRGNVAPTTVFYLSFLFAVSGGGDLEFFFKVSHQRESGNTREIITPTISVITMQLMVQFTQSEDTNR
jgi:hypothetical protein